MLIHQIEKVPPSLAESIEAVARLMGVREADNCNMVAWVKSESKVIFPGLYICKCRTILLECKRCLAVLIWRGMKTAATITLIFISVHHSFFAAASLRSF